MEQQEYILRFDSSITPEALEDALSREVKPTVIIVGSADLGHIGAAQIANMLKEANVPLIVGDVTDVSDEKLLAIINELPETQLGVGTDVRRNIAALSQPETMVIKANPMDIDVSASIIAEARREEKKIKTNNKHRRNYHNRNQHYKGRR